jgi:DNA-binding winged helix-turn-helix (wHTH) protein
VATLVRFGSHVLDPRSGVLWRGIERCALQSQPAELLALLIEHAGELVTREQIRARLWPDCVVEFDQNINFAIRQIRVALGSDAGMVQTVPRRGYRFIGDVIRSSGGTSLTGGAVSGVAHIPGEPGRTTTLRPSVSRRVLALATVVSVALTLGFGAGVVMRDGPTGQFVYDHLVHPDRCPYIRVLLTTHRNS